VHSWGDERNDPADQAPVRVVRSRLRDVGIDGRGRGGRRAARAPRYWRAALILPGVAALLVLVVIAAGTLALGLLSSGVLGGAR
jgi:hypothetical protein